MVWSPLTARVWTTRLEPCAVTCGLVIGEDHLLLIDTGSTPQQGAALSMAAARALGRPVDRVVVTHHHDDHCGGLAGLVGAKKPGAGEGDADGVQVWMHRAALARLADAPAIAHPTSLLAYIDLGGLAAEVVYPGAGHTDGDLVIRIPEEEVTFVGDLVETSGDPQADESTDFWNWPSAISSVISATDGKGRYILGHGDPVDGHALMDQNARISQCVDQVREEMEAGTPVEKIQSSREWPFSPETMADWIPRIADQLAARGITRKNLLPLSKR
ncbi:MAG: MBL fold metallo-hydrolase [Acidipropionibacterium sp.]|nr:MBL fold metallo-hydrolase [Acidipropionibacterium sp.]